MGSRPTFFSSGLGSLTAEKCVNYLSLEFEVFSPAHVLFSECGLNKCLFRTSKFRKTAGHFA